MKESIDRTDFQSYGGTQENNDSNDNNEMKELSFF